MTTIVVGYVPKAEGRAALRRAAEEAALRDAKLVVVNSHRGGRGYDKDEAAANDAALTEVREQLDSTGVPYEVRQLVRGLDPAEDLVAVAEQVQAEFIVIGLRRRSPVGKLILGSNAQRVLLDAPCPVLAVKAEPELSEGEED
ncbi:universal stress protein [Kribbella hippodromi]|uniref:Universal stress protein n=1 Tax=Kribbella hippodromi TaxID=434347 RepID=A0ABN2CYU5_9ACTN